MDDFLGKLVRLKITVNTVIDVAIRSAIYLDLGRKAIDV